MPLFLSFGKPLSNAFDDETDVVRALRREAVSATEVFHRLIEIRFVVVKNFDKRFALLDLRSDLLEVDNPNKTTNTYRIKFVVKNTAGGTGEFIPDAVKVDVVATQVDPMK